MSPKALGLLSNLMIQNNWLLKKSNQKGLQIWYNNSACTLSLEESPYDCIFFFFFFFSKQDGRLKVNDTLLEINREAASGKTTDEISAMMKEIEERSGSIELLVRRDSPISLSHCKSTNLSHRQPMFKCSSSWGQPSSQTPEQVRLIWLLNIIGQ